MHQISIAKVIAAKKIQLFMQRYMRITKTLLLFLTESRGFINNLPVSAALKFLERKLKYPSRSVQDTASALIHELEWENVINDQDWDIVSVGED
jgi:ABC-type uncharacterized transport system ATPase subunit